ncbi:MAG: translation initiation factor IF-3 [Clostridia bacterium]|nr:translation initiation factor IF-3 [Clostridia bacterium]
MIFWRCIPIATNELLINEQIRDREVRLIDENGEQLGIMPIGKALDLADERGLDLVRIVPNAVPPVCKIMNYGKYKFEQAKREKEAKKNQKVVELKEVRLSPTIEDHDINVRVKNTVKFLSQGDKVKVSIRFRGRQLSHTEVGQKVMECFLEKLGDVYVVERRPTMEGRMMIMVLAPKPTK